MYNYILIVILILSGCSGVGVTNTSNPDVKLQQAYSLIQQDRAGLAEQVIKEAMMLYKNKGDKTGSAEAYHAYGNLYMSRSYHETWAKVFTEKGTYDGSYMKSIKNMERASELFEEIGSDVGVVKSTVGIAGAHRLRNEKIEACDYYSKALDRYNAGKSAGRINNEPVTLYKTSKNMGEIIESYMASYQCDL